MPDGELVALSSPAFLRFPYLRVQLRQAADSYAQRELSEIALRLSCERR
jgi:hypothetical protein